MSVRRVRNGQWTHKKCSGVKGRLQKVVDYCCPSWASYGTEPVYRQVDVVLDDSDRLESVDKFCCLGDMLGAGGGAEEATVNRCGWTKFSELEPILKAKGPSWNLKGKVYRACVQSVIVYGSKTWALRIEDTPRLE